MDDTDQDKETNTTPWFGEKRYGFGIRPQSWQGWLFLAAGIIAETVIVSVAPAFFPSWFTPKQVGVGFTPATWQGWAVTLLPPLVILVCIAYLYGTQRKK